MNYLTRLTILVCCIGLFSCSPREWPDTPIQVYVGWSAGGSSDVMTRALLREMEKKLGVKILVTNITGANGSIAAAQIAAAARGAAVHGTWPILGHSDVTWTDFYAFLSVVMPTTLYVRTDAPWKTLEDLIADIPSPPRRPTQIRSSRHRQQWVHLCGTAAGGGRPSGQSQGYSLQWGA